MVLVRRLNTYYCNTCTGVAITIEVACYRLGTSSGRAHCEGHTGNRRHRMMALKLQNACVRPPQESQEKSQTHTQKYRGGKVKKRCK